MSAAQKLIPALYKLSSEDFKVNDDTILDKLYFHILHSATVKDNLSTLLPEIGDWFEVVIRCWTNKEISYGVQIFSLRFFGYIGSCIDGFKVLKDKDVLTFMQSLISCSDIHNDTSLMIPLVNSFEMVLSHEEGWKWTIETSILEHVVKIFYDDRSMYTARAGIKFISKLLSKSTNYNENAGEEIMSYICKPLLSNKLLAIGLYERNGTFSEDHNGEFYGNHNRKLTCKKPSRQNKITIAPDVGKAAKYLCDILQDLFVTKADIPVRLSLVYREDDSGQFQNTLATEILDICSSIQDHETFSLLLLMVDLSNLFSKDSLSCKMCCCLEQIHFNIHYVIKSMVQFGYSKTVVNFCVTCLSWLNKVKQQTGYREFDCVVCHQHEYAIVLCMVMYLNLEENKIKDIIMSDLLDFSREVFSQPLYTKCGLMKKFNFQIIQQAVFGLTRSMDFIQHRNNIVEVLVEVHFALSSMMKSLPGEETQIKPTILHLLHLLSKILEKLHEHNIRLDSTVITLDCYVKIVCTLSQTLNSVKCDVRETVTSLQIITKVLRHYVICDVFSGVEESPYFSHDIALLFNKNFLVDKLDSESWEVRDSTLELLQAEIDLGELMPYTLKNLFHRKLLRHIFEKAAKDESAYVRSSALHFFTKAVRCKYFRGVILPRKLLDLAIKTLLEDNMPIARISACNLIAALYINYVPEVLNDAEKIFASVFTASEKDLDWEVKKTALNFWQCTINKHLLDQKVPCNQAVVHLQNSLLDTQESISRIITVLETLGEIGCLKAIWLGVTDECDMKVSLEAQTIVEGLEKINEQWNFLEKLMEDHDGDDDLVMSCRRMKPKHFFSLLLKENWREKLDSRKNWVENSCDNLLSLLDHILDDENRWDDWDHNAVDCY